MIRTWPEHWYLSSERTKGEICTLYLQLYQKKKKFREDSFQGLTQNMGREKLSKKKKKKVLKQKYEREEGDHLGPRERWDKSTRRSKIWASWGHEIGHSYKEDWRVWSFKEERCWQGCDQWQNLCKTWTGTLKSNISFCYWNNRRKNKLQNRPQQWRKAPWKWISRVFPLTLKTVTLFSTYLRCGAFVGTALCSRRRAAPP